MGRGKGANSRKSIADDITEQKGAGTYSLTAVPGGRLQLSIFMHINGGKRCVDDEQSA